MVRRGTGLCVLMMTLWLSLAACGGGATGAEQMALDIRGEYLAMEGCSAELAVTADYGQRVYEYGLALEYHREGECVLTVISPEAVAGVTARLKDGSGSLEYDGVWVETGPLDESGMSGETDLAMKSTGADGEELLTDLLMELAVKKGA